MTEIVLATSNPHKIQEMNAIFAAMKRDDVRFISLADACPGVTLTEPAETGTTFEANATIKALSYAQQTGRLCLADDSGLEIDALEGRPGVISSHYCTDGRETGMTRAERDAANNARVLREMEAVPDEKRTARFVCVMVLGSPRPLLPRCTSRGTFEGRFARSLRGSGGFGYDPLFLVGPDFTRTASELPPEEKNRLSHRGMAARKLGNVLGSAGVVG
jgi:XTP/dITP diphosphohydrolase